MRPVLRRRHRYRYSLKLPMAYGGNSWPNGVNGGNGLPLPTFTIAGNTPAGTAQIMLAGSLQSGKITKSAEWKRLFSAFLPR